MILEIPILKLCALAFNLTNNRVGHPERLLKNLDSDLPFLSMFPLDHLIWGSHNTEEIHIGKDLFSPAINGSNSFSSWLR